MHHETIRIVVCGDDGVGKSSLIAALAKDVFVPNIQNVLPPITIPSEFSLLNDAPNTVVVDTSFLIQDRAQLQNEIRKATVIWLVYSDHYSCERISLFWMPWFRSMGVNLPVVLSANQCDLALDDAHSSLLSDEMIPILKEFKEIEACIRCSAKQHYNVNQAFYLCQRAVTHPIAPLFDSKTGNLKPAAIDALSRVFVLSDRDQDGYLNDTELLNLQLKCFAKGLASNEFSQIKDTLAQKYPGSVSPDGSGLSEYGFIQLNKIYAEKGRHETTWGILRRFHYTDSLSLEDKFLYPEIDVPYNSSVELSPMGFQFFVDLFIRYDKDNDGGLNDEELAALFKPSPGVPKLWLEKNFPDSIVQDENNHITLQGWLAQWSMTTALDYKTTTCYLAYLGYESRPKLSSALRITRSRMKRNPKSRSYRSSTVDRNLFNCLVLGSPGSGKTSLLYSFLQRPVAKAYNPTLKPITVVNSVEMQGGKQCYMVLEELGEFGEVALENKKKIHEYDVICYTYDSSDPESFSYLVNLRSKYPHLDNLPAVYVALKADLDRQQQRCDQQPDVYTRNLFMAAPLHVSVYWPASLTELFAQLAEAAHKPGTSTPMLEPEEDDFSLVIPVVAGTLAFSVGGALLWYMKRRA